MFGKCNIHFLNIYFFRLYNKLGYVLISVGLYYQYFCKQQYDQAAQPQNMTFFTFVMSRKVF